MTLPIVEIDRGWGKLSLAADPCFIDPHFEQENFALLRTFSWSERPVFLDIGAHQGLWTTFLAKLAGSYGRVYAFEPHPANIAMLERNIATLDYNESAPVSIMPYALGSRNEEVYLRCWNDTTVAATGMHQIEEGDAPDYTIPVAMRRLDSFSMPSIHFMKIDVEHWEWEVICGAEGLIDRDRPRILIETHNKPAVQRLISWCEDKRYPYRFVWATCPTVHWEGRFLLVEPPRE